MTHQAAARQYAEHWTPYDSPTERAYSLVADVARWPLLFGPCLHTDVLTREAGADRFRMWALTGDQVRSWTSYRTLDASAARVDFEQEISMAPLASMGGHWRIDGERGRLVLAHHWELREDTPEAQAWVAAAMERNSTEELAAIRTWAGRTDVDDLIFDFEEALHIDAPAKAVYDFLHRSDLWPQRLEHVDAVELGTTQASALTGGAEIQTMRMDTAGGDGQVHHSRSVRLCFPDERIVYKQVETPRPLAGHCGEWRLLQDGDGVLAVSRHRVALDPHAIEDRFGAGTTPTLARRTVQEVLGRNSVITLKRARAHVTGR